MDPNATLISFTFAHDARDFEGAREFAEDLAAWLAAGGFEPAWVGGWSRERLFAWLAYQPAYPARTWADW